MNAELAVRNILVQDQNFSSVTTKVYYDEAEQTSLLPFVVINCNDVTPNDTQSGVSSLDFDDITVSIFSATEKQAKDLANYAMGALDRISGTFNSIVVESITFNNQRKYSSFLVDMPCVVVEQDYQVMTQQ